MSMLTIAKPGQKRFLLGLKYPTLLSASLQKVMCDASFLLSMPVVSCPTFLRAEKNLNALATCSPAFLHSSTL